MHKQHHTYTNHIERDPELTSYYTHEQLANPGFRNVPLSRCAYFRQFDVFTTFKCRAGRIIYSACGVPVDYSGTGWSLKDWTYSAQSGIMRRIQMTAVAQITIYMLVLMTLGQTICGIQKLLFWWIAPVIIGYPAVNYVRNLEHADCEVSKVSNCLRNTRSVRSNPLMRLLLWDTNYHAVRYLFFKICSLSKKD
jgi:fatty acid desaturase